MRGTWAAVTVTVMSAALLGLPAPATAAPGAGTGPDGGLRATVICDDLGAVSVVIVGNLARGGSVRSADPASVRIVGRPGLAGHDASGRAVVVAPTGHGVPCAGLRFSGTRPDRVLPVATLTGLTPAQISTPLTGTITLTASVQPIATAHVWPITVAPFPYAGSLETFLATRAGYVTMAVKPVGGGPSLVYTRGPTRNVTASVVKVDIMATVMRQAQEAGRGLTTWETSQLMPMIRYSDNAATTRLWNHVGGGSAVARVNSLIGLHETTPGPGQYWGLTLTTPKDQLALLDQFATSSSVLSSTNRAYGLSLMRSVTSSQAWGVTAGPTAAFTAVKNGWLPRTDGWHVNSIGYVAAGAVTYQIAVFTQDPGGGTMSAQIATIEGLSRIVWAHEVAAVGHA